MIASLFRNSIRSSGTTSAWHIWKTSLSDATQSCRMAACYLFSCGRFFCLTFFIASVYSQSRPTHMEFSDARSRNSRCTRQIQLSTRDTRRVTVTLKRMPCSMKLYSRVLCTAAIASTQSVSRFRCSRMMEIWSRGESWDCGRGADLVL
jgi:hypothetical protein